jgi:hypothetical protein
VKTVLSATSVPDRGWELAAARVVTAGVPRPFAPRRVTPGSPSDATASSGQETPVGSCADAGRDPPELPVSTLARETNASPDQVETTSYSCQVPGTPLSSCPPRWAK